MSDESTNQTARPHPPSPGAWLFVAANVIGALVAISAAGAVTNCDTCTNNHASTMAVVQVLAGIAAAVSLATLFPAAVRVPRIAFIAGCGSVLLWIAAICVFAAS